MCLRFILSISVDDSRHQAVSHDILLVQANHSDSFYIFQNAKGFNETTLFWTWKVNLGHVARYNHFGVHAHAGEEHLDLGGRCVLGFVEDDNSIVEGATTHECQGRDLDDVLFHHLIELLPGYHVLKRIVERLQVRVNLVFHVTRKESQLLPSFHGWPGEYDAPHLFILQGAHGKGDTRISLARTGRTDGEDHIMRVEGMDQSLLVLAACCDGFARDAEDDGATDAIALGAFSLDDMQELFFRKTVVFVAMSLQFVQTFLKSTKFFLVPHGFDDIASSYDSHFWVKCLEHLHVGVVDAIKDDGVSFLKDEVFFCHSLFVFGRKDKVFRVHSRKEFKKNIHGSCFFSIFVPDFSESMTIRKLKKRLFLMFIGVSLLTLFIIRLCKPEVNVPHSQRVVEDSVEIVDVIVIDSDSVMSVCRTVGSLLPINPVPRLDFEKPHRIYSVHSYRDCFPDLQEVHYPVALAGGVPPVENREDAEHRKKDLLYVGMNPYYCMDPSMSKSIPYLVPKASHLLQHIGRRFIDSLAVKGIPLHKIIVTSVLRTEEDVRRLRRINGNASEQSCHRFGTTFDISYNRYHTVSPLDEPQRRAVRNDSLKYILSEVLRDVRSEGLCYIKYEVKQGCFHITVR